MKKTLLILLITSVQSYTLFAQIMGKLYSEVPEISIIQAIYYLSPLEFEYSKNMDEYNPVWLKAFYATENPEMFEDYPKDALPYFHKDMGATEESLRDFQNRYKPPKEGHGVTHRYIFGEFEFVWSPKNRPPDTLRISMAQVYEQQKQDDLNYLGDWKEKHGICGNLVEFFVKDHGIYKNYPNDVLLSDLNYSGRDHNSFVRMLSQLPSYQISYLQEGKRVFKTICN